MHLSPWRHCLNVINSIDPTNKSKTVRLILPVCRLDFDNLFYPQLPRLNFISCLVCDGTIAASLVYFFRNFRVGQSRFVISCASSYHCLSTRATGPNPYCKNSLYYLWIRVYFFGKSPCVPWYNLCTNSTLMLHFTQRDHRDYAGFGLYLLLMCLYKLRLKFIYQFETKRGSAFLLIPQFISSKCESEWPIRPFDVLISLFWTVYANTLIATYVFTL